MLNSIVEKIKSERKHKLIKIDEATHKKLAILKAKYGYRSISETIEKIIAKQGDNDAYL